MLGDLKKPSARVGLCCFSFCFLFFCIIFLITTLDIAIAAEENSELFWPSPEQLEATFKRLEPLRNMIKGFVDREETPSVVLLLAKVQIGTARVAYFPYPDSRDYGLGWVRDRFGPTGRTLSVSHGGMFGTIQWIDNDRNLLGVLFTPMPLRYAYPLHRLVRAQVLALFPRTDKRGN